MENNRGDNLYLIYASLLSFPEENIEELAAQCADALRSQPEYPKEATKELDEFIEINSSMPLDDLQGIYSYTFELAADHTLDLAFHMFDGFKRANVLVSIKEMFKAHGFAYNRSARGELPDNLTVILKFLAELKDLELKEEFTESMLVKALEKISKSFATHKENPYGHIIRSLLVVVDADVKKAA